MEQFQNKVKCVVENGVELPSYATDGSAGADVKAHILTPIIIEPHERACIPTGLKFDIPNGYEIQLRPRSGLALKHGVVVLNTPATIDSDYIGEIKVILINHGKEAYTVQPKERIAQMVLNKVNQMKFEIVENLKETSRNEGGFGSSGKF